MLGLNHHPRIPYIEHPAAECDELVRRILARRGGTLINLDRMLLHSAALAEGWNVFLGVIRRELAVPPKLRELAICAVAVLNAAPYEFQQHVAPFLDAGGTQAAAQALKEFQFFPAEESPFGADENAVLQLTVEMTRDVTVSDATFERVKSTLKNDQQTVELVAIIAAYSMVSRFLVALQIDLSGEPPPRVIPEP